MVEPVNPIASSAEPDSPRYRQYPFSISYQPDYSVEQVRTALTAHDNGQFYASGLLVEIMLRDPVISGVLESRVRCAMGARFEVLPAKRAAGEELASYVAERAGELLPKLLRGDVVDGMLRSLVMMGFALAQVVWADDGTPSLEPWLPRNVSTLWSADQGIVWRADIVGSTLEVFPDDGRWCLVTPGGRERSWMGGAVRSLGIPWIASQYALRDWLRYSERHGMPLLKGKVPAGANWDTDKARFQAGLENLGSNPVMLLPQGVDQSFSYDVEIAEATANTWESFKGVIDDATSKIAKRLSGTDVEATSGGIGSGQADASESQRYAIARGDARVLAEAIQDFVLRPWAQLHFGDADLAPEITVHLEGSSEAEARARLMLSAGQSVKALVDAGVALDVEAFAKSVGIPLLPTKAKNTAPLFAYHLEYGIPTVNEVRATLGLDAREGGNEPTKPPAPAGPDMGVPMAASVVDANEQPVVLEGTPVAAEATPGATSPVPADVGPATIAPLHARRAAALDAIDYSDKIVSATRANLAKVLKPDVDMVLRELDGAKDYKDAKARVLALYRSTDASSLTAELSKAGELAHLAGLYSQRGLAG